MTFMLPIGNLHVSVPAHVRRPARRGRAARRARQRRDVHLGMLYAVLDGGGVASVADLAAAALGGTVVVALPALDLTVCAPDRGDRRAAAVRAHVEDRGAPTPLDLAAEAPVRRGGEPLGAVVLLGARRRGGVEADEVLRLAALAVRTAVALEDGQGPRRSSAAAAFFADLRRDPPPSAPARRGARGGAGLRPALRRRRAVRGAGERHDAARARGDRAGRAARARPRRRRPRRGAAARERAAGLRPPARASSRGARRGGCASTARSASRPRAGARRPAARAARGAARAGAARAAGPPSSTRCSPAPGGC